MKKKQVKFYAGVLVCLSMTILCGCNRSSGDSASTNLAVSQAAIVSGKPVSLDENYLESWNDGADSMKEKIVDYVTAVTDKNSSDFIPEQNRIATFDMDGTILCEKEYWAEFAVAKYRIETDLSDDKDLYDKLQTLIKDLQMDPEPEETSDLIEQVTGEAFEGMSEDEFAEYVTNFMLTVPKEGHEDYLYVDTFYKPMLELFTYLQANDFNVYIVSGSERGVIWGCVAAYNEKYPDQPIDLERSHMIGADMKLIPSHDAQDEDGYIYQPDDELLREDTFDDTNVKMDKVDHIYRQIGITPIFAGGNTDGDFCMLNYAKSNKYKSFSLLIWHDDTREAVYNLNEDWKNKAEKYNWELVSMKDEFNNVFID